MLLPGNNLSQLQMRLAYTRVFATELIKRAERDDKIVAINAAMPSGTGLDLFAARFPIVASMSVSPNSTLLPLPPVWLPTA